MRRDGEERLTAALPQLPDIIEISQSFHILPVYIEKNNIRALDPHFGGGNKENFQPLGSGKNLRPIKNRVVQGNGEDGETESPRPSQKFVRRIIQFVLRIIEGVDMEIELDPIGSLFSTCARAHGGGRLGLRHPKPQARLNNPMTEKEPKAAHCTAAPGKTRTLKNFS